MAIGCSSWITLAFLITLSDLILANIANNTNEQSSNGTWNLELECYGTFNSTNATKACQLIIVKGSPSLDMACVKISRCMSNCTDYVTFYIRSNSSDCDNVSVSSETIMDLIRNRSYLPAGRYQISLAEYTCHTDSTEVMKEEHTTFFPTVNSSSSWSMNTTNYSTTTSQTDVKSSTTTPLFAIFRDENIIILLGALGILIIIIVTSAGIILCMRSRLNKMEKKFKALNSDHKNSASENPEESPADSHFINPGYEHQQAASALYDLVPYEPKF